ncbi:MAG: SHOCT-like domain-containing protein [Coprobacillus cateniformis]
MDEKLRILKMVEEGTMTAEQAVDLMSTMELDVSVQSVAKNTYDKKMFRVIVDSETGDKVNVQFPVGAIKKLLKATGKLPIPDDCMKDMDLSNIMEAVSECLDEEIEGDFVNVEGADGTVVRVFVDK